MARALALRSGKGYAESKALQMFFRESLTLMAIGVIIIALPVGYYLIRRIDRNQ